MNFKHKLLVVLILINVTIILLWQSYKNYHADYSRVKYLNLLSRLQSNTTENLSKLSKFRLSTPGCNISDLPLFDKETIKIFKNVTERIWPCKSNDIKDGYGAQIKINRFNETWIRINSKIEDILCLYRSLSRGKDDFNVDYGKFKGPIESHEINLIDIEIAHVACYKKSTNITQILDNDFNKTDPNLVYQKIVPLIPDKGKRTQAKLPNILLMAIDSTSYLNFKRHFTRARTLMEKLKFHELRGYTKVGINTFPNMIAWFAGLPLEEAVPGEDFKKVWFDDLPLIFRNYSELGFNSLMTEEMTHFGLFTYENLMNGFRKRIFDYETRSFQREIREYKYNYHCYDEKSEMEHSLDYTLDFIKAMKKRNQKYFAYISVSEMSHDDDNRAHYMDDPYSKFFENIFNNKLNEDTFIVFFSDHGMRYGALSETHTGEMEKRLPFIFIYIPNTLKHYPISNLVINQDRLTTPFDMHATLVNILEGDKYQGVKRGVSLFEKIKDTRTCKTANIPEIFCACHEDIVVDNRDIIRPDDIYMIMTRLNSLTDTNREICSMFQFVSIKNIYKRSGISKAYEEYKLGDSEFFIVQFYVNPGHALFEVLIRSFNKNSNIKKSRFEIIDQFIRINKYGDQSHCVQDKSLKNFCFCIDKLAQKLY